MSLVKKITRKSFIIRESGRSSDYITPSFGHGCLLNCSYCYMKRNVPEGLTVAKNTMSILTEINNHAYFDSNTPKPNQTDPVFITYDISCNEDFALHHKYHDWVSIFDFFKNHTIAKATFATKIIPKAFLDYNPNKKVRIRFSLMPQKIADIVEPKTAKIYDRISSINTFIEAGYDVHVNFSPVIITETWLEDYQQLFDLLHHLVKFEYKSEVKAEVIFLTHNAKKHEYNLNNDIQGEDLLWTPYIQESKTSIYGGDNIRYQRVLKANYIKQFKALHNAVIPWQEIRYIF